ncbi:class I SAM-dependent methyltransferase [Asanoa iriomotensis]|uniref:Methyltransferase domain-containing protein n=1 Tax=Asanoa iriomotensis TaxID=234613 RepID=A0ABQ4CF19_9ACTN|nr:class I SAM-dependent methyltransferase [Asanoa iriomotensis]GIF61372.1 hypothetical protein Air01nite_74670 [Asanoa iriomotensis]
MTAHRFYGDLAPWWSLISPAEDYVEEAAFAASLLQPARTVLELGSGGGHNAVHLKKLFDLTLVDLAPGMLAESRKINPELSHHQGDMRTIRLKKQFDAVFVHDAIDYMTTEADLRRAIETAYVHTKSDGHAVFVPDATTEIFAPEADHGGVDGDDGRGVRFLSWTYDPDPGDTTTVTDYAFLLKDENGQVTAVHETHVTGLYPRDTWQRLLRETGFVPEAVTEVTSEDRTPRTFFVGRKY